MQTTTGNNRKIIIRATKNTIAFAKNEPDSPQKAIYEPYIVRHGISVAANLREAFKTSEILRQGSQKATIITDSRVLLIPTQEFDEGQRDILYRHTFTDVDGETIFHHILPDLNNVAVFSVNKDLVTVCSDHFRDLRFLPAPLPIWEQLYEHSFQGIRRKLYAYIHDKKIDIFSFGKNRFRFANSFDTTIVNDMTYYLLQAWTLLGMEETKDELYIIGDYKEKEQLTDAIHVYISKVHTLNNNALYGNSPAAQIKNIPTDIIAVLQQDQ